MGVGTNIQTRAIALHHLDCPWRPADIAQREGRIVRQGNQNPEVQILRHGVRKTFDAYSWQTVERKASFIAQVMKGRLDVREIEDIGNAALSFAEVKALVTDDPSTLRRAQAQAEVTRLERAENAHLRGQASLRYTADHLSQTINRLERTIPDLTALAQRTRPTRGDAFTITVAGRRYTERPDAGAAILDIIKNAPTTIPPGARRTQEAVLTLGGHTFDLHVARTLVSHVPEIDLRISQAPEMHVPVDLAALSPAGTITRLENCIERIPDEITRTQRQLDKAILERDRAEANLGKPFAHAAELLAAQQDLAEVEAFIEAQIRADERAAFERDAVPPVVEAVANLIPDAEIDPDNPHQFQTPEAVWGISDDTNPLVKDRVWVTATTTDPEPVELGLPWDASPISVAAAIATYRADPENAPDPTSASIDLAHGSECGYGYDPAAAHDPSHTDTNIRL